MAMWRGSSRFSPTSSPTRPSTPRPGASIRVTATRDGQEAVIKVRDTGRGIDPALLPHIFEMFIQEHSSRSAARRARARARDRAQHRGAPRRYDHRSERRTWNGQRAHRSAAPHDGHADRAPRDLATDPTKSPPRPNPWCCWSTTTKTPRSCSPTSCGAADAWCTWRTTVPKHLQKATQLVPDVALLDIGFPVMDGYELARRLRELPAWGQVRLVALTGYGHDNDRKRSIEAGFQVHLVKPIDAATVAQVVCAGRLPSGGRRARDDQLIDRSPAIAGGDVANRFGRRGRAASSVRGTGRGIPSSSLTATDAAVMPNTDGTNATEPSTRFLCSQSLTPFWPPGHTHWNAPSS